MSNSTMLNAQPTTPVPKKSWLSWNLAGLLLLAVSFIVSLVSLVRVRAELFDPEVKVVRLLHWQLELGFRDALQTVIDDFNRMKDEEFKAGKIPKRIKVVQLGVTEKVYGQFLNTHLIAGTAPDICALGMASSTWGSTKAQFFEQFTDVLEQPNPYNARAFDDGAGLDPELKAALPNMPWKSTFVEGLQSGWDGELQGYYGVPPLIFTANRISVNLDMLKAATGSERLPTSLGEFLAAANAIRELGTRTGSDIVPVAGEDGQPAHFVSIQRDVSQRKAAEAALTATSARLSSVIDAAMDAVISTDDRQRIIMFNAAAESMFGYRAQDMLGESIDRLIPPRFQMAHQHHVEDFAKSDRTKRVMGAIGQLSGVRASGQEFPIEASISQVIAQDQKIFTIILRDVTDADTLAAGAGPRVRNLDTTENLQQS